MEQVEQEEMFEYILNLIKMLLLLELMINVYQMEIVLLEQEYLYHMKQIHQE